MLYENGINAFREEKRQEAIKRFETQKQLKAEQAAAIEAERAAQAKPIHGQMIDKAAANIALLDSLEGSGDYRATAYTIRATKEALEILQYILSITEPQEGAE